LGAIKAGTPARSIREQPGRRAGDDRGGRELGAIVGDGVVGADHDAHKKMLEDIRSGHFAESETGHGLKRLSERFKSGVAPDVLSYLETKTELVLRGEEIMLAVQEGEDVAVGPEEREKVLKLEKLERKIGRSVLAAINPKLGFSRNDLWELEHLKKRAKKLDAPRK